MNSLWKRFIDHNFHTYLPPTKSIFLAIFLYPLNFLFSQEPSELGLYEISMLLTSKQIGHIELPMAVDENNQLYISVQPFFDYLQVRNNFSEDGKSLSGYLIDVDNTFSIDATNKTILYKEIETKTESNDLIQTELDLYLKSDYFGKIFGLQLDFNLSELSVELIQKFDGVLPILESRQREEKRNSLKNKDGEILADTTIGQNFTLFNLAPTNWSIKFNKTGNLPINYHLGVESGSVILGGKTDIEANYFGRQKFRFQDQTYNWKYVTRDFKLIKQIDLFHINPQLISNLSSRSIGVEVTNSPISREETLGTYAITDEAEPQQLVELYINGQLIDYTYADPSGFFDFNIPLNYGNTALILRFYDDNGQEVSSRTEYIFIPAHFIPKKAFEYTLSSGFSQEEPIQKFTKVDFTYALNYKMMLAGGVEYITSSSDSSTTTPFLEIDTRPFQGIGLSSQYVYNAYVKNILNRSSPSGSQMQLRYNLYQKDQTIVPNAPLEERGLTVAKSYQIYEKSISTRLNVDQSITETTTTTTSQLGLAFSLFGISTTLNSRGSFADSEFSNLTKNMTSTMSNRFKAFKQFNINTRFSYSHGDNELTNLAFSLDWNFSQKHNPLKLTYQHVFESDNFTVGISYDHDFDLSFAKMNYSVSRSGDGLINLAQSANGSIGFDDNKKLKFSSDIIATGTGLVLKPYLDLNYNEVRDTNEVFINGLEVSVEGGKIVHNKQNNKIVKVLNLKPYTGYLVKLFDEDFEVGSYKIRQKTLEVITDPYQMKIVEIPIAAVGEVSGMVYIRKDHKDKGQGRITVNFYDENKELKGRTLTERDGFFYYSGLYPGKYTAEIDYTQLSDLGLVPNPKSIAFTIKKDPEGDFLNGIDFRIIKKHNLKELIIYFKVNSVKISKHFKKSLDGMIDFYKKLTEEGHLIEIIGYADPSGVDDTNHSISRDRAYAVEAYFLSKGIGNDKLEVKWRGSIPFAKMKKILDDERKLMRKVEIKIIDPNQKNSQKINEHEKN